MSIKHFTQEEINELCANPYVKNVSKSSITYTQEFRELFVKEYEKGKTPSQILKDAGFNSKIIGRERIRSLSKRFRAMASRIEGFKDTRKGNSGRPATKDLTPEEEISRLKHKVKYLEQENEFLKKIKFLDRQTQYKQNRKKNLKLSLK